MSTHADSPAFPASLTDRYQPLGVLGAGAFGAVFRARDRELDRDVAIKVLAPAALSSAPKRLRHEAEALARLRHPGVVEVFGSGEAPEGPYMVMEYLEGASLATGREEDPLAVMLEVAVGLEAVHQAGLLHRDVKPSNIVRTKDGRVVLVDFGLVQAPDLTRFTGTGDVVGTPIYMAPELLIDGEYTRASDWFAWGRTLEVLAGARLVPGSPLAQVVAATTDPDPARRPRDMRALRELTHQASRSEVEPRPVSVRPPATGLGRRGRLVGGLALVGLGVLLGRWVAGPAPVPPGRSSPPSGAAANSGKAQAARAALVDAVRAAVAPLLREHRAGDGELYSSLRFSGEHEREVIAEYQDGRVVPRVRRLLERVRVLALAAPATVEEVVLEEVTPLLLHLGQDEQRARIISRGVLPGFLPEEHQVLAERAAELERLRLEFEALPRDVPGLAGAELAAYLWGGRGSAVAGAWLEQVTEDLDREEDPTRRLRYAGVLGVFMIQDTMRSNRAIQCDLREFLWNAQARAFDRAEGGVRSSWWWDALGRSVWLGYQQLVSCRSSPDDALRSRLADKVEALDAGVRRDERHALAATETYLRNLVHEYEGGTSIFVQDMDLVALVRRARVVLQEARRRAGLPALSDHTLIGTGLGNLRNLR
jgi:serine/threonine-protein kinase